MLARVIKTRVQFKKLSDCATLHIRF